MTVTLVTNSTQHHTQKRVCVCDGQRSLGELGSMLQMVWYPARVLLRPMRYAMRTMSTRPARAAPTMMGMSMFSWSIRHSSATQTHTHTLKSWCCWAFVLSANRADVYLLRTGFLWHWRAEAEVWTCWERSLTSQRASAQNCTCMTDPQCPEDTAENCSPLRTQLHNTQTHQNSVIQVENYII